MRDDDRATTDKILDLLLDALLERQQSRDDALLPDNAPEPVAEPAPELIEQAPDPQPEPVITEPEPEPPPAPVEMMTDLEALPESEPDEDELVEETAVPWMPQKLPTIHLEQMLGRLTAVLAVLLIVVNIPFNRFGTSLARAMPDTASLIIRDGLVLKGTGEKIYVLEENKKRWITTLDAFDYYGYSWQQVRLVDDPFLNQFEDGRPIYLLLKCNNSPHIYALEDGHKRWIKDIPTFEANGFVWEDIRFVTCNHLRTLPDGTPIPPDAGTPPQP